MLRVGIAGIGFMGLIHFLAYQRVPGVRVAAICSRSKKKLAGDWRGVGGNFGPPGKKTKLAGIRTYKQLADMVADPDLDIVDVCLPSALHCQASVTALEAGKHVFCEKPIALGSGDATRMLRAAEAAGTQLLIGHVVPFFPEYAYALQAAREGRYGKLLGGHFKRMVFDTKWSRTDVVRREEGEPLLEVQIHDAHFVRLLFGMPLGVFSRQRRRGKIVEYAETQFLCDDPTCVVSATSGFLRQPGRPFNQGFEIYFEKATLMYDFAVIGTKPHVAMPLTVFDNQGGVKRPRIVPQGPAEGFVTEIKEVVRSIGSGAESPILDGRLAADALALCHAQAASAASGRMVKL